MDDDKEYGGSNGVPKNTIYRRSQVCPGCNDIDGEIVEDICVASFIFASPESTVIPRSCIEN